MMIKKPTKKARLFCIADECTIHDLGVYLKRGEVMFVPELQAKRSSDLMNCCNAGDVRLEYVDIYHKESSTAKTPDYVRKDMRNRAAKPTKMESPVVLDKIQDMLTEVQDSLKENIEESVKSAIEEHMSNQPTVVNVLSQESLGHARKSFKKGDTPVFIPDNLTSSVSDENVRVEAETHSDEGVEEAAEALKKLKKRKKND